MAFRSVVVALGIACLLLVGCTTSKAEARWNASLEVSSIWGVETNDVTTDLKEVDDGMSESHRMMAIMILSGAGENSDLDSYSEVYLADVKTNNGSNTATVVVVEGNDGRQRTIVPQAIQDQGRIAAP